MVKRMVPVLLLLVLPVFLVQGCNEQQIAAEAQNAITAVINIAKAEAPDIPVADQPTYTNFVNLAITLETQLQTCNAAAGTSGSQLVTCFNTFAGGLLAPAELAQLRILNPKTQGKVQLYATGVIAAVNIVMAFFKNAPIPAPVITPTPTSSKELRQLKFQAGY